MVQRLPSAQFQCIGVVNQEAHAKDVWPIGYDDALNASFDVATRKTNAHIMLERFPALCLIPWFIDPPTRGDSVHHVGGSLNDTLAIWPHKYTVFNREGVLLYRTELKQQGPGLHYIDFSDLERFVEGV